MFVLLLLLLLFRVSLSQVWGSTFPLCWRKSQGGGSSSSSSSSICAYRHTPAIQALSGSVCVRICGSSPHKVLLLLLLLFPPSPQDSSHLLRFVFFFTVIKTAVCKEEEERKKKKTKKRRRRRRFLLTSLGRITSSSFPSLRNLHISFFLSFFFSLSLPAAATVRPSRGFLFQLTFSLLALALTRALSFFPSFFLSSTIRLRWWDPLDLVYTCPEPFLTGTDGSKAKRKRERDMSMSNVRRFLLAQNDFCFPLLCNRKQIKVYKNMWPQSAGELNIWPRIGGKNFIR